MRVAALVVQLQKLINYALASTPCALSALAIASRFSESNLRKAAGASFPAPDSQLSALARFHLSDYQIGTLCTGGSGDV